MNKCMHCVYSCPTGSLGGYNCDYVDHKMVRQEKCSEAIKAMNKYNETRNRKNTNNE